MNPEPAVISKRRIWMKRLFRWIRICCLLGVLASLIGLIYMSRVGLPEFIKKPLLEELKNKGLELSIGNLRLHWFRGIVGEKITLADSAQSEGAKLTIEKADIRLNRAALWRFKIKVESMFIHQACLSCPPPLLAGKDQNLMTVDNVSAELRFLNDNLWQLASFKAQTLGLDFDLSATVTNGPSLFKKSKRSQSASTNKSAPWIQQWQALTQVTNQWIFRAAPSIKGHLWGDANNWSRMQADMTLNIPGAKTPWGELSQVNFTYRIEPIIKNNKVYLSDIKGKAQHLIIQNSVFSGIHVEGRMVHSLTNLMPESAGLVVKINESSARWGKFGPTQAALGMTNQSPQSNMALDFHAVSEFGRFSIGHFNKLQLNAAWAWSNNVFSARQHPKPDSQSPFVGNLERWLPSRWAIDSRCQTASNRWARVDNLSWSIQGEPSPPSAWPENLDFWRFITPANFNWELHAGGIQTTNLNMQTVKLNGKWRPPKLSLNDFRAGMESGELALSSELDILSRKLNAKVNSTFDAKQCLPFLDTNAQRWLNQFAWESIPPQLSAEASLTMPSWTNRHPNWRMEVLPAVNLNGFIQGTNCSYRSVSFDQVSLHLLLSNSTWHIPDLKVQRPEGFLNMAHTASIFSKEYSWIGVSTIDLKALKPLLTQAQQKSLDFFQFSQPPHITGGIWGTYQDLDRLGLALQANITNFSFKSEALSSLNANVTFSNQLIRASDVHIYRGTQQVHAPLVTFETDSQTLTFSNVAARMDVGVITRPIGPKTAKSVSPYRFDNPPQVLVNGFIIVPGPKKADMTFLVSGGPFHFSRFNLPSVSGLVRWQDDGMVITNFSGHFYDGAIEGWLGADFRPTNHTDLNFQLHVTNVNAKTFIQDISLKPKRLEGILSGGLVVTYANSTNFNSWQGYGAAKLERGLIWDMPLFGIMSPVLNTLAPGIGNSKAEEASGRFTITNSVIRTRDTQIQAQSLRIYYDGTVDFDGRIDATVEASFFRNTWLVGRLLSFALSPVTKIFEYKVTGTLAEPKLDPLYIPSIIMAPLRPVRTFKEIFQRDDKEK